MLGIYRAHVSGAEGNKSQTQTGVRIYYRTTSGFQTDTDDDVSKLGHI